MLLNHLRHDMKVSIPFYLHVSINENINGYREKNIANLALHEGLLVLIYEYFKAQTLGKEIYDNKEREDVSCLEYVPLDFEDSVGLQSEDQEEEEAKNKKQGSSSKKRIMSLVKKEKPNKK